MARIPRKYYDTSFFHVIVQGINKEYIFEEDKYIEHYLELLKKHEQETGVDIIAYCIMNNHAHILLYANKIGDMSQYMQKVNTEYAKYYNYVKSNRKGYVFRDRFASEPIMNERYLIKCINYIHFNPVKARIVQKCIEYKYSSYIQYINGEKIQLLGKKFDINIDIETLKDVKEEYVFKDLDIDEKQYINQCIANFLEISNMNKNEILQDKVMLKFLIVYLKKECNIKYVSIMESLKITKGQMERMKKR